MADRVPDLIRLLVYIDAFVPNNGQSQLDLLPEEFRLSMVQAAEKRGDRRIPMPRAVMPPEGELPPQVRERYLARTRPHPLAALYESIHLSGSVTALPRAFIHCTG